MLSLDSGYEPTIFRTLLEGFFDHFFENLEGFMENPTTERFQNVSIF